MLMRRVDEIYTARPFYGSRNIWANLRKEGYKINRKRVQGMMQTMGIGLTGPRILQKDWVFSYKVLLARTGNFLYTGSVWTTGPFG
jgi:hypothetical protein